MVGWPHRADDHTAAGDARSMPGSLRQLRDDGREGCRSNVTVHDDDDEQDTRDRRAEEVHG